MRIWLDSTINGYRQFLAVKSLPHYEIHGRFAEFPDEYASLLGIESGSRIDVPYVPNPALFDYQRDISAMAIAKRRFAVFADCGLGKTLILAEFARHVSESHPGRRCLIVSPLMVVGQTIDEFERFYGDTLRIEAIAARDINSWMEHGEGIGITNYESMRDDLPHGSLAGLILDESSMLKSHYGKWGQTCLRIAAGVPYKLALTGTPAPNDRIEYANHAVFVDAFPNVNSFLARFFVNRGQTSERWVMKPHALRSFYRALSHWCIFLNDPSTYGWSDNVCTIPPIVVHIDDVSLSESQRESVQDMTGDLFVTNLGGITTRARLGRLAKCDPTVKPAFIARQVASWPEESTIVWCRYNDEQAAIARMIPGCESIDGSTPIDERKRIVVDFKAGIVRTIVTKPKILGFGLNLQVCTRQVFSGMHDSYEEYYQAVKRSNRIGSTRPLHVHIPVTEIERPMVDNVLRKAKRVEHDTREQEEMFREASFR